MPIAGRNPSFLLVCILLALVVGCAKDVTDYPTLRLVIGSEPPLQPGATIATLQLALRSADGTTLKLPAPGKEADLTFALPAGRNIVTSPYTIDITPPPGSAGQKLQLRVLGMEQKQVLTAWTGVIDSGQAGPVTITLRAPQANCDADSDGVADCTKPGCCSDPGTPSDCNDDATPGKDGLPKGYSSSPFNTEDPCTQCGNGLDEDCDGSDLTCVDGDKDGVPDCQETACPPGAASDPAIYPGAAEVCDGKDNDCNLIVDDALPTAADPSPTHKSGEPCGVGACAGGQWQCDPTGAKKPMVCSTDSKKTDKEDCGNDIDDDCDGQINQGCALLDIDGDGVNNDVEDAKCAFKFAKYHAEFYPPNAPEKCCPIGTADTTVCDTNCDGKTTACDATDKDGDGYPAKKDCDDNDPLTYFGAPEKCGDGKVQSCQGTDPPCDASDKDGDGWMAPADCDDGDKEVNPEAKELCNGKDDNCNGIVDDGDPEGLDSACGNVNGECGHVGDAYGKATGISVCKHYKFGQVPGDPLDCATAFSSQSGTCVGCDGDQRPKAEVCNYLDDDCNAKTDEPFSYTQEDKSKVAIGATCDGVGACGIGKVECVNQGAATCSTDPNGSSAQSKAESCNAIDDNCNGKTDENLATLSDSTCQKVGVCASGIGKIQTVCNAGLWICDYSQVPGIEIASQTCAAGDALCTCAVNATGACHKMAEASCDGLDNDCDGNTDEDFAYTDFDGVTQRKIGDVCLTGACGGGAVICADDAKSLTCSTLGNVKPEKCNAVDDNCNGKTDEASDLPVEKSTCKQIGVCAAQKPVATCADGAWLCDYANVPGWQTPTEANCDGLDNDCNGTTDEGCDDDGDGYCDGGIPWSATAGGTCAKTTAAALLDCNDSVAGISPGATELCNNQDDNCDGNTDEGCDSDEDGYCDASMVWLNAPAVCPLSTSATVLDCNDSNPAVHPAATETCNGVDDNCSVSTDEGCDDDGDAYCDGAMIVVGTPAICLNGGGDCNDGDEAIHPGAIDYCDDVDNDCNGTTDDVCDSDKDGYCAFGKFTLGKPNSCPNGGGDCNDSDSAIHPGASDVCDDIDNDCNTVTDDACDGDSDGYCTAGKVTVGTPKTCASGGGDCNDADSSVHPDASETCNGVDDNCSGVADEGVKTVFFHDGDGDGFGDSGATVQACSLPTGYALVGGDCDDSNSAIHPGATEICNGLDDDCNGENDEGVKTTFWFDGDSDGFGLASAPTDACSKPTGYASVAFDCNDANSSVHPGVTEACNGYDDDCNGVTDGVNSSGCVSYYVDGDGDGFGPLGGTAICQCGGTTQNPVKISGDCNDDNASVYPGATEVCNGIDDNCDTVIDEGVKTMFYRDADLDNYGNVNSTKLACTLPTGYLLDKTDCDDTNASVHPGATEVCNGIDDNCDSAIDEGVKTTFYRDADGDGFGNLSLPTQACSAPANFVVSSTDCNDGAASVHPGATEVCNGVDDNCSGVADENVGAGDACNNKNAYGTCTGVLVCNGVAGLSCQGNTPAADVCDGTDNNCNGSTDEGNPGGGLTCNTGKQGVCGSGTTACTDGGVVCNQDTQPSVEICDAQDNDCNGIIDNNPTGIGVACTTGNHGICAAGTTVCTAGGQTLCSQNVQPSAESCNGLDDNCDGVTDEGYGTGVACGMGVCAGGTVVCSADHQSSLCSTANQATTESCDGKDNNCNGFTDEGGPGSGMSCGTGLFGVCSAGTTACTSGAIVCNQNIASSAEICDGEDNNCDGAVDNGDPGGGAACNSGKLGACAAGTTACSSGAIICNQNVQPSVESCDGIDNNCNGILDEGNPGGGQACATGKLGICGAGTTACSSGAVVCNQNAQATSEICDGLDNDCDGAIDSADASLFQPNCENQTGACSGAIKPVSLCSGGAWGVCSAAAYTAHNVDFSSSESCDGKDNNCNGSVDESNPGSGQACSTGKLGVCAAGTTSCGSGALVCNQTVQPSAEVCDGLDNDCNGAIDSADGGLVRPACANQLGVCVGASKPVSLCSGGAWAACTAATYTAYSASYNSSESCDGKDNNCNGVVDEGDPGGGAYCGTGLSGVCADGTTVCSAGAINCSQNVGPSSEVCNGIDDNCNGAMDEGNPGGGVDCSTGLSGVCSAGTTQCSSGAINCVENISPGPEVCDGQDNDCDGLTDAMDPGLVTTTCEKQAGVCQGATKPAALCSGGAWQVCTDPVYLAYSTGFSDTEICNDGQDNTCDGQTDEGCP
jgi:hypothetical protein